MSLPRPWIIATAVIGVALIAFLPSLGGGWIYDDHTLIENNPHAHSLGEWAWWLTHDFWYADDESARVISRISYWRPLISASYALDWTLGGGEPLMFHITNLLAHAVVVGLAFAVLRRWLAGAQNAIVGAALAAALFAVHPTKAESVAWISGRTDVLCTIGLLVATIGIGRRLRGARQGVLLEVLGTAGAYLCKEQAIVLPAFVLVELWVALDRPAIDWAFVRRSLRTVAPQCAIAIAYLAVRSVVLPMRAGFSSPEPIDHLLVVLDSLGRYVELIVAPVDLSVQQGLTYTLTRPAHSTPHVIAGGIALVGLTTLALLVRKRRPVVTLGLIVFAVTLAPTTNIIYTGISALVSERFLYLPALGLALIAGDLVARADARRARLLAVVLGAAVLACVALSARRSADFVDEDAFWRRELARNPDSREARNHLVKQAIEDRHYVTALRELLTLKSSVREADLGVEFTLQIVEVVTQLVPDLETEELRAIDTFAAHLLARDVEQAMLSVRGVSLSVDTRPAAVARDIERLGIRLWALRATLATRIEEKDAARAYIARAHELCPRCVNVVTSEALVLARIGDLDGGLAVLDAARGAVRASALEPMRTRILTAREHRDASLSRTGPAALLAQAQELATLELWGAAYHVLAPHKEAIAQAPGAALGFAELAFRAGATDVAREVLGRTMTDDAIDAQLADWGAAMGWAL